MVVVVRFIVNIEAIETCQSRVLKVIVGGIIYLIGKDLLRIKEQETIRIAYEMS